MREIQASGPTDFAVTLAAAHFRHPSRRPACQANSVGGCSRTTMAARDKGSDGRSVARAHPLALRRYFPAWNHRA
jgi:hypothetical protein